MRHCWELKGIWLILCSVFAFIFLLLLLTLIEEITKDVGVVQRKILSVICIALLYLKTDKGTGCWRDPRGHILSYRLAAKFLEQSEKALTRNVRNRWRSQNIRERFLI